MTEVGVIPEDWEVSTLGETCAFENGDRGKNYPSTRSFAKDALPFINAGHVAEGRIRLSELDYISKEDFSLLGSGKFVPGDILFCLRGSLGKFGVVGPDLGEGAIASSLVIVRPRSASLGREYLSCYFRSTHCTQMISKWSGGAAQPNLGAQDLACFAIPLPPTRAEQEAIAEALSDADALIESLEQLMAKKCRLKQGAMQELLIGKRRLPGFSGEWVLKRLEEISHIKTGGRNNEDKIEEGEYPFFVRSATVERINSYSYDCEAILIPGEGGIGSIFHYVRGRFDVHQRVYAITQFTSETSGRFVYYYVAEKFGVHAMQNSVKATVDSLRLPTFQNFEIVMPPTAEEQTAIAASLSDMDAEIAALEAKLAKARSIKQGMMQELLTGRIRLV
ncbi:MAG: restriction endonuclease subunit S [Actinobacteria bacterium]|nr:restriction endonuclease subunit S [Actinomycetota bacterium]